jgi:YD repeat-containing protein
MSGMYAFDWGSLGGGNYEFQYVALDGNGQILNQQSGTFNTSNPNAPSVSAQTPLAIGGPGRAFVSNSGINGMGSGLQLINQGADAASVEMRYRLKNSNGDWLTPGTSFAANNSFGIGSFVLDPAGLSGMVNGNQYDVQFIIKNSSGTVLRTATGTITKDTSGLNISPLQVAPKLTFTQPTTAKTLDIRYRLVNTGTYSLPIRLTTIGNGQFEWDPTSLISNFSNTYDYDFDIQAQDADGMLVNHNQVNVRLGATTSQLSSQIIALPQVLRIKPTQTGINYMQLSYRVKGSSTDYSFLNNKVTASTNDDGSKEYRFELPATLTAGDYEYRYTAYAADTVDANGDPVQTALGSSTGYFTAGTTGRASRLDWVIATNGNVNSPSPKISRSQSYNAFGDIVTETDGRGNVTSYTYNTLGAMTKKVAPKVSITAENGAVNANATPTTEYTYDALGRVIAVKDANGNLNTQVWRAGSTEEGNITLEKHADGGIKAAGFDIFGNKRTEYDELATSRTTSAADATHRTDYTYDKENRLTKVEHQARNADGSGRSVDQYSYDAVGNRISHTNADNNTEKTTYDSLGRVTKTTSFMGFDTSYAYTYLNNLTGVGGATVGGWQKVTIDTVGRTLTDKLDMFNHLTWHEDLGGHQFTYSYNQAGWLMSQTGTSGQNIAYSYYNNGYIQSIQDKAVGMYTYYQYDDDGNKTFEGYISLKDAQNFAAGAKDYYQYATITYDAMNRMTSVVDPKAAISYEYDAVGNRRMVHSEYYDGANGSRQIQEYWYKYDSMNRFLITMGALNGARSGTSTSITRSTTGVDITYNATGQRTQAINGSDNTTEGYSYTNDGYLTDVKINGTLSSQRTNDALGRVTTYQQFGSNASTKNTTYDKDNRVTQETGTDGTTNYYYYTDKNDEAATANAAGKGGLARVENKKDNTTVNTYYAYQYWDDAKQFAITNQGYNPTLKGNNNFWKPGYSELKYDVNGHLVGANDAGNDGIRGTADDRTFRYVNDAQGLILFRDEIAGGTINRVQRYYYVDGKRIGDVGNDGDVRTDYVQAMAKRSQSKPDYKNWKPVSSADFDQNYEPISPSYPGFAASTYTVKNGDTLQSIARSVWGDGDMWYLIADANGLTNSNSLTAGQVLTIPNKVTNIHNNSGTYRVYNPGEAIGDVNPTLPTAPPVPRKKKKGCGGFASIIVAAVAVVATIYTAGAAAAAMGVTGASSATLGATMASGMAALGGSSVAAAAIGGAVGSIAGQLAGNALGVQSGFSWSAVATAGLTSGVLSTGPMKALTQAVSGAVNGGYAAVAARAVVSNVVGQGIGNITGSQKGFSWSSVAVAGVGAVAGAALTENLGLNKLSPDMSVVGAKFGRAAVDAGAFALTQLVIKGGKVNWMQVASDTVTNFIQNGPEVGEGHDDVSKALTLGAYKDGLLAEYIRDPSVSNNSLKKVLPPTDYLLVEMAETFNLTREQALQQIHDNLVSRSAKSMALVGMIADVQGVGAPLDDSIYANAGLSRGAVSAYANGLTTSMENVASINGYLGSLGYTNTSTEWVPTAGLGGLGDFTSQAGSYISVVNPALGGLVGSLGVMLQSADQIPEVRAKIGQLQDTLKDKLESYVAAKGDAALLSKIPDMDNELIQKAFSGVIEMGLKASNKIEGSLKNMLERSPNPWIKSMGVAVDKGFKYAQTSGFVGEAITEIVLDESHMYAEDSVRAITNRSNQGVDIIAKPLWGTNVGKWVGFEVKSSISNNFKMSSDQKEGAAKYLRTRIDKLADGKGAYGRGLDESTQAFARMVQREQGRTPYHGYAILNGYINDNSPQSSIQIWNKMMSSPKLHGRP